MWSLTSDRAPWEFFLIGLFWLFCLWTLGFFRSSCFARPSLAPRARLLLASFLCWFLAAPRLIQRVETPTPIEILLDDSASLKRKLDDGASTWERAVELARVLEESARNRGVSSFVHTLSDAKFRDVDEASKIAPNAPYSPLSRSTNGADASRVFFFSDGIERVENVSPDSAVPSAKVDAIALGSTRPALDLRLEDVAASSVVYPGERARFHGKTRVVGAFGASLRCKALLWERRANESKPRVVWSDSFDVLFDGSKEGESEFEFDYEWEPNRENAASYWLTIVDEKDAQNLDDGFSFDALSECCVLNNVSTFDVEPRDKKLRVLLIDEYARNEYRYLRELLRREEKVELQTILFSEDERARNADPLNLPFERLDFKTLKSFDVLVVGEVSKERWQGKEERLVGALLRDDATTSVWFLGSSTPPDARLAPGDVANVESRTLCGETEYWRPQGTNAGRRVYGDIFDDADEIEWTRATANVTPNASSETLLTAKRANEETPVLLVSSLGATRVLWQGVDEIWRLQTLADKSVYRRFVLRTLDYLTSGQVRAASEAKGTTRADLFDLADVETNRALIQEETNVEARADALERTTASTGGETLDLRDLDANEATKQARVFFERRLDETPKTIEERKTNLAPINVVVPTLFFFLFFAWICDVKKIVLFHRD